MHRQYGHRQYGHRQYGGGTMSGIPILLGLALSVGLALFGEPAGAANPPRALITSRIDEHALVTLHGNTRPEAKAANDRGAVANTMPLDHMMLQLQRPPEAEEALDRMIDALHDPASASYHRWLTPKQIAAKYGLAPSDTGAVIRWLRSHGFRVNFVYSDGMVVDFSGTAGQVRETFHTELHRISVDGVAHVATMSDPQIPAALAPAVAGIVRLNDFEPRPQYESNPQYAYTCSDKLTGATTCQAVTPADLATIYNFKPAFDAGITGTGQIVAVLETSDVDNIADWSTFRKTYGLAHYRAGSVSQIHPEPSRGKANCTDPGITSSDEEAILDAEWSGAAAPAASIVLAACKTTVSQDGLLVAVRNLTEDSAKTRPQIFSISYGECEADIGATANAAIASAYKTAVAGGVSVFVSGGDQLAAACDRDATKGAVHGDAVNARASTPYNVAVGGTDFADVYLNQSARYWSTGNSAVDGSARSYVPEIPWNGSCASELTASYLGFAATYGKNGLCNSTKYGYLLKVGGGGGGPSGCARGAPATQGVVGGTCEGYARPAWQATVPGLPANRVRNLPDVTLFAASSPWGHSYVVCSSGDGGCKAGSGGTSFAAPIMAGVQALVNQKMSATTGEGNPDIVYYKLAAAEYNSTTELAACNAMKGRSVATTCIFHDVTLGDNDAPCHAGSPDCYLPSGTYGVLSSSAGVYQPTFRSTPGWDFASGLGSVNVFNLVSQWHTAAP